MKHVLIHWTATNETSILTDAFVRDISMLQDPKKEGMVYFGKPGIKPPKSGWKAYLGRVIAVSDRREIIYEKEREFLGQSESSQSFIGETKQHDSTYSHSDSQTHSDNYQRCTKSKTRSKDHKRKLSGKRKRPVAVESDSDETDSDNRTNEKLVPLPPKRAKEHAEMEAYKKIVENMECPTNSLPPDSDSYTATNRYDDDIYEAETNKDDKILLALKDLQKEVAQLRKENMELQKRLPKLVAEAVNNQKLTQKKHSEMERKRLVYVNRSSPQTTSTPVNKKSGFSSTETPNNSQRKERNSGESDGFVSSEASSPSLSNPRLSDILSQSQLNEIQRSPSDKKMTSNLLLAVFGKKRLSESSVTGRKQGATECRPALDSVKVKLIIDHVLKQFPNLATEFTIKATMAQKCKDERRLMEARRKKAEEK